MLIAIPSYKRPMDVKTLSVFPEATVFVPESQKQEYIDSNYGAKIVAVPDKCDTGIKSRKNNCILDIVEDDVLLVDDDITRISYFEHIHSQVTIEGEELLHFVEQGFVMARELGTVLWGINQNHAPGTYSENKPFSFTNPICGPFMGILKESELRFDETVGNKEDYDFFLQVILKYRKALRFDKFHYHCGHKDNPGGCTIGRSMEREKQWAKRIEAKWGTHVIRYEHTKKNILNARVNVPIPGA